MKTRAIFGVLACGFGLAGCGTQEQPRVTADADGFPLTADQVVTLSDSSFGCQYKTDLLTALQHQKNQEVTAFVESTSAEHSCFFHPPAKLEWTVYVVAGPIAQIGAATATQYVEAKKHDDIDARMQYWVPANFLRVKHAPPVATGKA